MPFEPSNRIYQRVEEFPWQTMGGETIVIEPKNQISHEINEVGSLIWELLDGRTTMEAVEEKVCQTFETSGQDVKKDIFEFVEGLREKGLVHCLE